MTETYNKNLDKEKIKRNDSSVSITSPSPSIGKSKTIENVLILQGGGSLGAFGCGVYKALAKRNIKIDIVAGTSIGAVNAAIIAGTKDGDSSEQSLEQFWLELSSSFVDLNNSSFSYLSIPGLAEQLLHALAIILILSQEEEKKVKIINL
jgi:predicted acylesterase/phospholipase RssA